MELTVQGGQQTCKWTVMRKVGLCYHWGEVLWAHREKTGETSLRKYGEASLAFSLKADHRHWKAGGDPKSVTVAQLCRTICDPTKVAGLPLGIKHVVQKHNSWTLTKHDHWMLTLKQGTRGPLESADPPSPLHLYLPLHVHPCHSSWTPSSNPNPKQPGRCRVTKQGLQGAECGSLTFSERSSVLLVFLPLLVFVSLRHLP